MMEQSNNEVIYATGDIAIYSDKIDYLDIVDNKTVHKIVMDEVKAIYITTTGRLSLVGCSPLILAYLLFLILIKLGGTEIFTIRSFIIPSALVIIAFILFRPIKLTVEVQIPDSEGGSDLILEPIFVTNQFKKAKSVAYAIADIKAIEHSNVGWLHFEPFRSRFLNEWI